MAEYIYKAGKDYVKASMDDSEIKKIVDAGEITMDYKFKDFPICVNKELWVESRFYQKPETKKEEPVEKKAKKNEAEL